MKSRAYRRSDVKLLDRELLVEAAAKRGSARVSLGLDIAKDEIVAVLRWSDGVVERPWSLKNPTEIHHGLRRLPSSQAHSGSEESNPS